ncbi:MAG TPA: hypothetical protein VMS74_06595 [Acidimicrobiia bacterium]|nr:hypothetical protein [Acidimicrobiia bacterium]
MNQYYEGYVRARRVLDAQRIDHGQVDEVVIRQPVRYRVGTSLVSLGHHLMGVTSPEGDADVRPAA